MNVAGVICDPSLSFCHCCVKKKRGRIHSVKDWKIIADNLSKAGWSWGWVTAVDSARRTIWIVDAHRDDGQRFSVRADEKLTAFLELEAAALRLRTEPFHGALVLRLKESDDT